MSDSIGSKRAQFEQEAAAIKEIIYSLANDGNVDSAKQVFEQYVLLNPMDPEVGKIKMLIYTDVEETEHEKVELPEKYGILDGIETIFILAGLIFKRVGNIDSALRKVKLMEDNWGYRPLILTCIHNIDNRQARTWLETAGDDQVTLNAGTRMLNVYEYFQKSYTEGLENIAVYDKTDDGTQYVETADNAFDVFDGDTLVRKEFFNGYAGSLRRVSYYDNNKRIKDMVYDDWGYLNYIREFYEDNEIKKGEKYYTTDGELCIETFYDEIVYNEETPFKKLLVYNGKGDIAGEYKDSAELASLCLEQIISDDKFYILIAEDGLMAKAAISLDEKRKNVAKCEVVHSIFLNDAYDMKSKPQKFYKYLCDNHSKFDGIIMMTQAACRDFAKLYGNPQRIFVIPHPYPYEICKVDFNKRDTKKAVIVSRLNPTKLINMSIDIFALVVKQVPDARLEIYGRGDEEANLQEQITRLGLDENVFLMGYTDDPLMTFKTAALSIMTSMAEGYGMTIMESICNGCPAFAFDIKYGPSEIIQDGLTGFLIPRFDVEIFARKIIMFFKDEKMQRAMSDNCYADVSRFNTDKFLENWFSMTEELYNRYL